MKHTPGPWKIIDHDMDYIAVTDEEQMFGICELREASNENRSAMIANANLIVVAPEMFLACQGALVALKLGEHVDKNQAIEYLEEVLSKVRGEK